MRLPTLSRPIPMQIRLTWGFGVVLLMRLLLPFFDSPLAHLFSDPLRHWNNGLHFFHPDLMGGNDPFLYQAWIALLQWLASGNEAFINFVCGLLCALMPFGWYRALRELLPKSWALGGAAIIGLWPSGLGIYAYFMNETLLLSVSAVAFWATLRARRKATAGAFAVACALWLCAAFTRTIAAPLALLSIGALWLLQSQKMSRLLIGLCAASALLVPAAWHSRLALNFPAPLGNLYLNEIYAASGNSGIAIEAGAAGSFWFTSPSFNYRSFYPFSDWISDRSGVFNIHVDLSHGRTDWQRERTRAAAERTFSRWRQRREDFIYLMFAQSWPDCDLQSISGWLTVWSRWLWLPLLCAVMWGVGRGWFRRWDWLLPACGLGAFLLLALQSEDAMEGRFRKPVEPILLAAATVMLYRRRERTRPLLQRL